MQIAVQRTHPAAPAEFNVRTTLSTQTALGLPWSFDEVNTYSNVVPPGATRIILSSGMAEAGAMQKPMNRVGK